MNNEALKKYVSGLVASGSNQIEIARKCHISPTAMSQFLSGKYGAKEDSLSERIAQALGFVERDWKVVESVKSYRQIEDKFKEAKEEHVWIGISSRAGIGKTESLRHLYLSSPDDSVEFLQARTWTARQFLLALVERTCGVPKKTGYLRMDKMIDLIVTYFNSKQNKPVLIIDEADKLRPAALGTLIPIYNGTEERLGAIISGTENLEKEIKRGARLGKKGYDEIDSRLGREFVRLLGATKKDVKEICHANGVRDEKVKEEIWGKLDKVRKETYRGSGQFISFVEDFRRLMRLIKTERTAQKIREGLL